MDRDNVPPIVGAVLLVAGILIVFFVFTQALGLVANVGDYFRQQFPEEEGGGEEVVGPTAAFSWSTSDLDVDFMDESEPGDANIRHWEWDFGDGGSSNQNDPSHTYNFDGDYRVSLRVEDQNGETHTAYGDVRAEMGNFDSGRSEENFGDMNFEIGFGNIMLPFAAAVLVGILFIVMFLVGAAMIKAGWNLLKPGPSTLKLKIKPKKMEVEQSNADPAYSQQSARAPQPVSAQPHHTYQPQTHPDAVIASMRALPAKQSVQQARYPQTSSGGYANQQAYASYGPPNPLPQNPTPPSPSFESQPPQPVEASSPHPDQTNLGAYQSSSKVEEPRPEPEITRNEPVTTEVAQPAPKVEQKIQQTPSHSAYQSSSNQTYKAKGVSQPAQRKHNSTAGQNYNARPKQQQKRTQNTGRSQSKRNKSKKRGKNRKK